MKAFDAYEVHGVTEFGTGRRRHCEQVSDAESQFWSLYGHIPGEGLECIGDFKTRQHAEEVLARITGRRRVEAQDPDRMNDRRSAWATAAPHAFIDETGTDEGDALGDLLADLMHWCDRHDYDFDLALDRARGPYEAETEKPQVSSVTEGEAM